MKIPKSPKIHRTPEYRAKAAYRNMLRRCKGGKCINPSYRNVEVKMTLEQWLQWAIPEYQKFLDNNPDRIPNACRIGDSGNYELGNIEIKSKEENSKEMKRTPPKYRDLICPVCGILFTRRANRIDHKIKQGNSPCCSRKCGGIRSHK